MHVGLRTMLLRMEGSPGCASERTSRHRGSVYFGVAAAVAMLLLTTTAALAAGGAWTIVSSPNSTPVQPEVLNSVSCTSPTFCPSNPNPQPPKQKEKETPPPKYLLTWRSGPTTW